MNLISLIRKKTQIHFARKGNKTKRVSSFWQKNGPDFSYFAAADNAAWVDTFWAEDAVFRSFFNQLDLSRVLEIACGSGRHSWQVREKIGKLTLLDSSVGALELARERFADISNVHFVLAESGEGMADCNFPPGSFTAVFSYDAMVHFEPQTVGAYLRDAFDSLSEGGFCLIHHSNYDQKPGGDFAKNPGWRNYMNVRIFNELASKAGFRIVSQEVISFVGESSDALTLLKK